MAPVPNMSTTLTFLTRGLHQLATRALDDAMNSFQTILSENPTNLLALLGKVCTVRVANVSLTLTTGSNLLHEA